MAEETVLKWLIKGPCRTYQKAHMTCSSSTAMSIGGNASLVLFFVILDSQMPSRSYSFRHIFGDSKGTVATLTKYHATGQRSFFSVYGSGKGVAILSLTH